MHAQGFVWHVWFWPPQGPSFVATGYAELFAYFGFDSFFVQNLLPKSTANTHVQNLLQQNVLSLEEYHEDLFQVIENANLLN